MLAVLTRSDALTSTILLRTEKLTRSFGRLLAVNAVDFEVHAGELRSVIGPNGAGKSTFFKLIAGELPPTSGRVSFDGGDVTAEPQFARSQRGIAKSYQITTIFPHLTVFENVRVAVQCRRTVMNCWARADRLPASPRRRGRSSAPSSSTPRPTCPRPSWAMACSGISRSPSRWPARPTLLLLDEPTAGMSPEETERTIALVKRIAAGRTVIVVEHKMKVVMAISDRITVLHQGAVLAEGSPEEIRAHDRVQEVYLGRRARAHAAPA